MSRPNNLRTAAVHSAQRRRRRERRHDPRGARGSLPVVASAARALPVTLLTITTSSTAGTVSSVDCNYEYRCVHCNAWPEEHVDLVHCLFSPTDYAAPGSGEPTEYRLTVPASKLPTMFSAGTALSAGDSITVWGTTYTVKP